MICTVQLLILLFSTKRHTLREFKGSCKPMLLFVSFSLFLCILNAIASAQDDYGTFY